MRGSLLVLLVACTAACSSGGSATGAGGATSDASAGSGGSAAGGGAGGHAGGGGSAGGTNDASAGNAGSGGLTGDAAAGNGGAAGDAGGVGGSDAGTGGSDAGTGGGTYRNSLSVCWTDPYCPRVFAVAHGGAWNVSGPPYDSNAAIAAAYAVGCDGVKIDVRVTKDNVPVISHSSPLQYYESIDCGGKKIEEMTAAQVTQCHRFPSTT